MRASLASLRRIRAAVAAGQPLAPADAERLAGAIDAMGDGKRFEPAFGLSPPWRRQVQAERRVIALADAVGTEGSERARARAFATACRRYAATAYPADARRGIAPLGQRGVYYRVLQANGGAVPSFGAIRKMQAAAKGYLATDDGLFGGRDTALYPGHEPDPETQDAAAGYRHRGKAGGA